jgi:hypothetical protein
VPGPKPPDFVCEGCGCINEGAAATIEYLTDELDKRDQRITELLGDRENLERDLRSKRSTIKQMRSDRDKLLTNDAQYDTAMGVLEHWKTVAAPNARELGGARLANCLARLHGGYLAEELKKSVDGYALKPYVVNGRRTHDGPKDSWVADAEFIFRNARNVDQGLRIADRADDLRQVMQTPPAESAPPVNGNLSPLGAAAVRMAEFGFYVFPVKARDKVPVTAHGLLDAKRDVNAIRACWSQHPHLNVAVRCGAESGIVVLDVDGDDGWDSLHALENENEELPTTLSVTTPRGGQHFYWLHPGVPIKNTTGFPGPSLDIRGDGGYVLAPPSIGPGGKAYVIDEAVPFKAMPDWLLNKLVEYQRKMASIFDGKRDYADEINKLGPGSRNDGFTRLVGHWFAHNHDFREVLSLAALVNKDLQQPLSDKELRSIVESISKREARKNAA